jgi:L-iditol 2-dehydrogenase
VLAYQLTGPARLEQVRVAEPAVGDLADGEVLVRVLAGGLCGSDVPRFLGGGPAAAPPPRPGFPLHEIVGEVVGSADAGLATGDLVVGWAARMDGLAELVVSDAAVLARCDLGLRAPVAVVAQPLACVLYAVERLPDLRGASTAVVGLGPIGLLFAAALKDRGAASVTGIDPVDRREVAAAFGLDVVVQASSREWAAAVRAGDPNAGPRPTVVVEAVGHQTGTVGDAISAVADGGRVYCFGIPETGHYPVDLTAVVRRNLTVAGGLTRDRDRMLREACRHLAARPELAERLVSHVLPVAAAPQAYVLASTPAPGRLKVVIDLQP